MIEKCQEGGEGIVINILPKDYTLCNNNECKIKNECKRFLDYINHDKSEDRYVATFCNVHSNLEDYDYKSACNYFIDASK
jgi:hypothetical protein